MPDSWTYYDLAGAARKLATGATPTAQRWYAWSAYQDMGATEREEAHATLRRLGISDAEECVSALMARDPDLLLAQLSMRLDRKLRLRDPDMTDRDNYYEVVEDLNEPAGQPMIHGTGLTAASAIADAAAHLVQ